MNQWTTLLTACGILLANIPMKSGIFQGDSLFPILFYVALNPMSIILNETTLKFKSWQKLHHWLYLDDLKMYAKTEHELKALHNNGDIFVQGHRHISWNQQVCKCRRTQRQI